MLEPQPAAAVSAHSWAWRASPHEQPSTPTSVVDPHGHKQSSTPAAIDYGTWKIVGSNGAWQQDALAAAQHALTLASWTGGALLNSSRALAALPVSVLPGRWHEHRTALEPTCLMNYRGCRHRSPSQ